MNTKDKKYIKDVVIAAIKRKCADYEKSLYISLTSNNKKYIEEKINISQNELPLVIYLKNENEWLLLTTEQIIMNNNKITYIPIKDITAYDFSDYKNENNTKLRIKADNRIYECSYRERSKDITFITSFETLLQIIGKEIKNEI